MREAWLRSPGSRLSLSAHQRAPHDRDALPGETPLTAESAAAHLAAVLYFDEILIIARAALLHSDADPEIRRCVVRLETQLEAGAVREVGAASAKAMHQARKLRELLTRFPSRR